MAVPSPVDTATTIRTLVGCARERLADAGRALDVLTDLAAQLSPEDGPIKACACGAAYSREAWGALDYVGQQDDGVQVCELRNCRACGSTIAVVLGPSPREENPR